MGTRWKTRQALPSHPLVIALEVLEVALLLLLARLPLGGGCGGSLLLLPPLVLLESIWLEPLGAAAVTLHRLAVHQLVRVFLYQSSGRTSERRTAELTICKLNARINQYR